MGKHRASPIKVMEMSFFAWKQGKIGSSCRFENGYLLGMLYTSPIEVTKVILLAREMALPWQKECKVIFVSFEVGYFGMLCTFHVESTKNHLHENNSSTARECMVVFIGSMWCSSTG